MGASTFTPTTTDPQGPGTTGHVLYPSRASYETHQWFSTTSMMFGTAGAVAGAAAGALAVRKDSPASTPATVVMAGLGAALGIWLGNRTPPA